MAKTLCSDMTTQKSHRLTFVKPTRNRRLKIDSSQNHDAGKFGDGSAACQISNRNACNRHCVCAFLAAFDRYGASHRLRFSGISV